MDLRNNAQIKIVKILNCEGRFKVSGVKKKDHVEVVSDQGSFGLIQLNSWI